MKFNNLLSDDAVTEEIGHRIVASRLERRLTQAQLAEAAGVSKRTVERLEDGAPTQVGNLIRCLRVLDKLEGLERLLPETPVSPVELLKRSAMPRSRVRRSTAGAGGRAADQTRIDAAPKPAWTWGDQK